MSDAKSTASSTIERSQWSISLVIALGGICLFSAKPIVVKLMYAEGVGSEVTLALRMAMSVPLYMAIGLIGVVRKGAPGLTRRNFVYTALVGLTGYYGASYLDLFGLEFIPAQIERMVIFIYPVFVALISWLAFQQRMTKAAWIAFILAYLGIAAAMLGDVHLVGTIDLRGIFLCIASAILFACYIVFSKPLISAMGAQLFTSIAMSAASLGILLHVLVSGHIDEVWVTGDVLYLAVINALFCTVLPSYLASIAIGRLGGQTFSILGSAGPVVTSLMAVLILGELFGPLHAAGLVLVISSIVLLQRTQNDMAKKSV